MSDRDIIERAAEAIDPAFWERAWRKTEQRRARPKGDTMRIECPAYTLGAGIVLAAVAGVAKAIASLFGWL